MQTIFNPYGVTITYALDGIYLYALVSPSDDIELEFDFKNEREIKKIFGKELNEIDQIDLIWYAGSIIN